MHAIALCLALAPPALAARDGRYEIDAKLPAFVVETPLERAAPQSRDDGVLRWLLSERQTHATDKSLVELTRYALEVRDSAGLGDASEVRVEFDPSYQRLTLHRVRVYRGDGARDALDDADVRLLQRERNLDLGLYEGALTALIFIPDVRVGDVVEVAYSLEGWHPSLVGRYSTVVALGAPRSIARVVRRLVVPAKWQLSMRRHRTDLEPTRSVDGGEQVYLWSARDTVPVKAEDRLPPWFDPYPHVWVSTFSSWADVVAWGVPLYEVSSAARGALRGEIERLRSSSSSGEQRVLAALALVQHDVRYLGMELGEGGMRPRSPDEVLARRFGDCKDKSLLLVTLLRALEVPAHPVLVNSERGRRLDEALPSPSAFDHVIVRADVGGRVLWLDATELQRPRSVDELVAPPLGYGLVLRAGEQELVKLPDAAPAEPDVWVVERFRVKRNDRPVQLVSTTTFRGRAADAQRIRMARLSRAEAERFALNFYARTDPGIELEGPLEVKDDNESGALVVTERYKIRDFFTDRTRSFTLWETASRLGGPEVVQRHLPLAVDHPQRVRHDVYVHLPEQYEIADEDFADGDDALSFRFRVRFDEGERVLHLSSELQSLKDHVAPERAREHLAKLAEMRRRTGYSIVHSNDGADEWVSAVLGAVWPVIVDGCLVGGGLCAGCAVGYYAGLQATP